MDSHKFSRRAAMFGAAALPVVRALEGQARPKQIVISTANRFNGGVNCCAKAMEVIKSGGDTLDAVIAGVNIVELDPRDNSVGRIDRPRGREFAGLRRSYGRGEHETRYDAQGRDSGCTEESVTQF